jgi:hypothetical protein
MSPVLASRTPSANMATRAGLLLERAREYERAAAYELGLECAREALTVRTPARAPPRRTACRTAGSAPATRRGSGFGFEGGLLTRAVGVWLAGAGAGAPNAGCGPDGQRAEPDCGAAAALGAVRRSGASAHTCARHQVSPTCPYSHVHVRRESLGFVYRSRAILCRRAKPFALRFAICCHR